MPVPLAAKSDSGVPARYEPAWWEIPWLAWVAARAYRPRWAPGLAAAVMACCSLLVWFPIVATMRAKHRLASLGRYALLEVAPVDRRGPPVVPMLVGFACLAAVLIAVLVPGIVLASLTLQAGGGSTTATVTGVAASTPPIGLGVLPMLADASQIIRSKPVLDRTISAVRAESPGEPIWRLASFAAWPQRRGHGSRLLESLLEEWHGGGYAACFPRDAEVESVYVRLGMRRHPADGGLLLDLRSGWTKPSSGTRA